MRKYAFFFFLRTRHSDARMSIEACVYVLCTHKAQIKCVLRIRIFLPAVYAWRHIILISQSRLNVEATVLCKYCHPPDSVQSFTKKKKCYFIYKSDKECIVPIYGDEDTEEYCNKLCKKRSKHGFLSVLRSWLDDSIKIF